MSDRLKTQPDRVTFLLRQYAASRPTGQSLEMLPDKPSKRVPSHPISDPLFPHTPPSPFLEESKQSPPLSPFHPPDSPVQSTFARAKHPIGSVYHHANSLSPNGISVSSSTNNSSAVSGSVEVIVSELENPVEDCSDFEQFSGKSEDEDMSETEKVIRNIIKQRSKEKPADKERAPDKEKPLDLHECISTILMQRKEENKKLEDQRWQLKQHILEFISQSPVDPGKTDRNPAATGTSFNQETGALEDSLPKIEEYTGETQVSPYQHSAPSEPKAEASYVREASFRQKSPKPSRSPRVEERTEKPQFHAKVTNRKIVKTALAAICLSGEVNKGLKEQVIEALENSGEANFVIVFKGTLGRQDFAALYSHDLLHGVLVKVVGPSQYPCQILPSQIHASYRYDSSSREFRPLPQRRLTLGTDAVSIQLRRG